MLVVRFRCLLSSYDGLATHPQSRLFPHGERIHNLLSYRPHRPPFALCVYSILHRMFACSDRFQVKLARPVVTIETKVYGLSSVPKRPEGNADCPTIPPIYLRYGLVYHLSSPTSCLANAGVWLGRKHLTRMFNHFVVALFYWTLLPFCVWRMPLVSITLRDMKAYERGRIPIFKVVPISKRVVRAQIEV